MKKVILVITIVATGLFFYIQNSSKNKEGQAHHNETETDIKSDHVSSSSKTPSPPPIATDEQEEKVSMVSDKQEMTTSILNEEAMTEDEMKEITQEVMVDFEAIDVPQEFPEDKAERFTILNNMYLKSSYYLNEVAAGNLTTRREDLHKAFSIILLYSEDNTVSDVGDVLDMIEKDNPQIFQEALQELRGQEQIDKIRRIQETILREELDD